MRALFVTLCAGLLGCACHKPDPEKPELPSQTAERSAQREAPSVSGAFAEASYEVHASAIVSRPVTKLPEHVAVRGMALPLYSEFPSMSYEQMLDEIVASKATHVSVVVSWNQRTIQSNKISPRQGESPKPERVIEVLKAAKKRELAVILFPILHVQLRNEGEWRGKLAPSAPELWWRDYRDFTLHWAKVAREGGADIFSVGSELSSMEGEEQRWRQLIAATRQQFDGELIYSANWDHYEHPAFWDALDFVGVSSYFEVARRSDDPIHVVSARWRGHRENLMDFAQRWQKPLILTEVGYPSVPGAAVQPWNYAAKKVPDALAQAAAYRSLLDGWHEPPRVFGGLVVWHGWGPGGREDTGYSIFEKPAQGLIQRWYLR